MARKSKLTAANKAILQMAIKVGLVCKSPFPKEPDVHASAFTEGTDLTPEVLAFAKEAISKTPPLIFGIGDEVEYIPYMDKENSHPPSDRAKRYHGRKTIIEGVHLSESGEASDTQYATLEGAWFSHRQFKFVKRATSASLRKVAESKRRELEDEEEFVE